MPQTSNAARYPASELATPRAPWRVIDVVARQGYVLSVRFADGLEGEVRMAELILSEKAGVFAPLRDYGQFDAVHVEAGVVTWPGGLDLAPDAIYDDIAATGTSIVRPFEG